MFRICKCKVPLPIKVDEKYYGVWCQRCGKKIKEIRPRKTWNINPASKVKQSDKIYKRNRDKKIRKEDIE